MFSFIWWLGLILILVSIPIHFYCVFSDKADKRLNNLAILILKDLGGYNYRQFTFISLMIIGVGWIAVLAYIIGCLFEWLGWI